MLEAAIPIADSIKWQEIWKIPIKESGEKLIPASYIPEKILCRPQYFVQGIDGAIPECFMREGVFAALRKAATLLPRGYRLVIYDAWRPFKVQQALFLKFSEELRKECPNDADDESIFDMASRFVSPPKNDPDKVSPHMTGGAVDVGLADECGLLCPMGGEFDETSKRSVTHYFEEKLRNEELMPEEREYLFNRRILYNAMIESNFINYADEWWHYDYGNQNWAASKGASFAFYGKISLELRWAKFD